MEKLKICQARGLLLGRVIDPWIHPSFLPTRVITGELQNRSKERAQDVARLRSELNTWQAAIGLGALDAPLTA